MSWFGEKKAEPEPTPTPVKAAEPDDLPEEKTEEELQEDRDARIRQKLLDSTKDQRQQQNFTYDKLMMPIQRVMWEQTMETNFEGLKVTNSKQAQNAGITSKWLIATPQTSNWDISVQMNGFSDMVSVGYCTLGRYQMMYQRMFKNGALGMCQMVVQPQAMMMGGGAGNLFCMLEYPWVPRGCTSFQYVKDQNFSMSHAQRLIRGVAAGATFSYDMNTHGSSMAYTVQTASADDTMVVAGEYKDGGEWKLGLRKSHWASDMEMGASLDYAEHRQGQGKSSQLSLSIRKPLLGGGLIHAVISGYSRLKATIQMPFGCERMGLNRISFAYNMMFDVNTSTVKHGISLTL